MIFYVYYVKSNLVIPNPKIFLRLEIFFNFFLIFRKYFFQNCSSKKFEPDMSPIFYFSTGIGKSDPQKSNLKVFLQSENFFYIFRIFKVFFKKP